MNFAKHVICKSKKKKKIPLVIKTYMYQFEFKRFQVISLHAQRRLKKALSISKS